jgi:hypothetical protein
MGYLLIIFLYDELFHCDILTGSEPYEIHAIRQVTYVDIHFIFPWCLIPLKQIPDLISPNPK